MIWTLRYKRPQGVAVVQIETIADVLDGKGGAREFGQNYVNAQNSPATRFISMEPWLVASEKSPILEPKLDHNQAPAEPKMVKVKKAGRIGA